MELNLKKKRAVQVGCSEETRKKIKLIALHKDVSANNVTDALIAMFNDKGELK